MPVLTRTIEGRWTQLKGLARKQWEKLTDEDLDMIKGADGEMIGLLMLRYGVSRAEAWKMFYDWLDQQEIIARA